MRLAECIVCTVLLAGCDPSFVFDGYVVDEHKTAIPNAEVALRCDGRDQHVTTTDNLGRFSSRRVGMFGKACSIAVRVPDAAPREYPVLDHCKERKGDDCVHVVLNAEVRQTTPAQAFWHWFAAHAVALNDPHWSETPLLSELQDEVDKVVKDADWEIGPDGPDAGHTFLAVVPNSSDEALNARIRALIDAAPRIPGWRFQLYKPHRESGLLVTFPFREPKLEIDARLWKVLVEKNKAGRFDVTFVCDRGTCGLDDDVLNKTGMIVLDNELGSDLRHARIGEMTVVRRMVPGAVPLVPGLLGERTRASM